MKPSFLLMVALSISLLSCTKEDKIDDYEEIVLLEKKQSQLSWSREIWPLSVGNMWVYDVVEINLETGQEKLIAYDTTQVIGRTIIGGETYYQLQFQFLGRGEYKSKIKHWFGHIEDEHEHIYINNIQGIDTMDVLYGIQASPFDSIINLARGENIDINVPAGAFTASHSREQIYVLDTQHVHHDHVRRRFFTRYVPNIGPVIKRTGWASRAIDIESRLSYYEFVEEN